MELLVFSVEYVALFTLPWILLILLSHEKDPNAVRKPREHYREPGWNFCLKRAWASWVLSRKRRKRPVPKDHGVCVDGGLVPTEEEAAMERPKQLEEEESMDSLMFFGTDNKRNAAVFRIRKKRHRITEAWVHIHMEDGTIYQLPGHPDTTLYNAPSKDFVGGGLKFQVCEPMRRWRVTFNGILRKGVRGEWNEDNGECVHVQFNFLWRAFSRPTDIQEEASSCLLGETLAREEWKSSWINMIEHDPKGYDQWGELHGTIAVDDCKDQKVLFLRGIRQRRWGLDDAMFLHRRATFIGCGQDGTFFCTGAASHLDGLSHMKFGHVRDRVGQVWPVESSDIFLPQIAEHKVIPQQISLIFSANGKTYNTSIQTLNGGAMLYGNRPWTTENVLVLIEFGVNSKRGYGLAEFSYRFTGSSGAPVGTLLPYLNPPDVQLTESSPITVNFKDPQCQSSILVGGKGLSLALMSSVIDDRFTVPPGFCITTVGFEKQLRSDEKLQAAVRIVETVAAGTSDNELKDACNSAVSTFASTSVTECVCQAVENSLFHLFPEGSSNLLFAVRSSAVGEDSEELSAAGQNETFLGCKGLQGILEALTKCWGSLYAYQSVQYRRQHGQPVKAAMGVVVQIMVPSDTAGVMFTRHPLTGDPSQLVITANYGLGESVVSALAEPDTIILSRDWNDKLSLKEQKCGSKIHRITMLDDGGTKTETVDQVDGSQLSLTSSEALRLGEIGVLLETMFGNSRDIEWAIAKDRVYLLQARPITSHDAWTDFELLHEFDSPNPTDNEVYTFANIGEVLPGFVSPLTISLVTKGLDLVAQNFTRQMRKIPVEPHCNRGMSVTHNRLAVHMIYLLLQQSEKDTVTSVNKVVDLAIFGHIVTTSQLVRLALERFGPPSRMAKAKMMVRLLLDILFGNRHLKRSERYYNKFSLTYKDVSSATEMLDYIHYNLNHIFMIMDDHCLTSQVSVSTQMIALAMITGGCEDWTQDHYSDISLLFSSCNNVVSADVPSSLKELAAAIASTGNVKEFCNMSTYQATLWLQNYSGTAGEKYREFLKRHGHRSIKEFDLYVLPWGKKPDNLVAILQKMVQSEESYSQSREPTTIQAAIDGLKSSITPGTKRVLKFLLPYCRSAVGYRENTKSLFILIIDQFRGAYNHLAQLLVKEGRLPDPELLFFLSLYELQQLIKTRSPTLVNKAIRRRKLMKQWDALTFPELVIGIPQPMNDVLLQKRDGSSMRLEGTPVCHGVVEARACVVLNLEETHQIQNGDILITHCTDIGWTPFFPLLGGVVTELGGLISHGAVVAREYGLPCIVGAEFATQLFKTGDIVRLDGYTGLLEKI